MPVNRQPYGLEPQHLVEYQGHQLESKTAKALSKMVTAAARDNIDIKVCSGFRDFHRQMQIWNNKASGTRPVLDSHSKPVELSNKSANEIIELILLWSALPGTSRHHWGTDVDLFDANQIDQNKLQLIPSEYESGGPCSNLYQWLLIHASSFGFYFPFQLGLSGVSPEPWHLSYFPVANTILDSFELETLRQIITESEITFRDELLYRLEPLVQNYVYRVAPSPDET